MLPRLHLPTVHSLSYPPFNPSQFDSSTIYSSSMDPSAVDFRAFYPYTPNEVKHRKRTTSAQLKILEGVFKRDTKPNAALRNSLAEQLDMTARGVQVWFQNRRAKEKNKAGKTAAASNQAQATKSRVGEEIRGTESVLLPQLTFPGDLPELGHSSSQESSPTGGSPPPQLHVNTDSSFPSWQSSPLVTPDDARLPVDFTDACIIRRGSLPADAFFSAEDCSRGPPLVGHLDPFARRRSVDASLHRLASNPYANIARVKNGVLSGSRISGYMREPFSLSRASPIPATANDLNVVHLSNQHPHIHHPHGTIHARHSSVDSRAFRFSPVGVPISPSPSPLSPHHIVRTSLPDNRLYAFSSRPVSELIPGPLPSPDFSFGIANTSIASPCSADSERNSPDHSQGFLFRGEDLDTEDDGTSASYGGFSRFGSIASIGTTDSNTSAYYSEVGSCVDSAGATDLASDHHHRRETSRHFVGLMSNLNVESMPGPQLSTDEGSASNDQYDTVAVPVSVNATALELALKENERTSTYPSPSSTVSPRGSPLAGEVNPVSSANVPISLSSELVYALQTKQDQGGHVVSYQQHTNPQSKEAEIPFYLSSASMNISQNQPSSNLSLEYGGPEYDFVSSTDPSAVGSEETGYGPSQAKTGVNDQYGVDVNTIGHQQVDYTSHPHTMTQEQGYTSFENVDHSSTSGYL